MGTKVQSKSYLPEYHSMREYNDDSSSSNWPLFYGDKTLPNGQYYSDFLPRPVTNGYPGCDKNALKQTMLEQEKTFRHQVLELHRLYKTQKDMMDEYKRKEMHKRRIPMETSSSSSPLGPQRASEDTRKWHKPNFSLMNSACVRPSISGAEMITSPLSCTGGNNMLAGQSPLQKCNSSKDCEILDSRPSKVRKKLFDLDLPADEYIDTEEEEPSADNKISEVSSFPSNKNHRIAPQNNVTLRNHVGLADLNEPFRAEETALPNSVGNRDMRDLNQVAKPKSQFFLGLPKEMFENSQHGSNNGALSNPHIENKGNGRDWLSNMCDTGNNKTRVNSIQGLQTDKSPLPPHLMHNMYNKAHQPFGVLPPDYNKGDLWRERTVSGMEPIINSNFPHPPSSFHSSSDMDNAWSHSISAWGKPNTSLTNNCSPVQTHPPLHSLSSLSRSSQSPANIHDHLGEKLHLQNNSRSKTGMGSGLAPNRNGFYQGSSSGSKNASPFPSVCLDYLNLNKDDEVGYDRTTDTNARSYFKGSNGIDMKPAKDFNLNTVLPKYPSNEVVDERKHGEHSTTLPWLKYKPACKNIGEYTNSSEAADIFPGRSETIRGPITLASCDREVGANRKILGVLPIFDNGVPKNDSSLISPSASLRRTPWSEDMKRGGENGMIDINMSCDPETSTLVSAETAVAEKEKGKEVASYRTHIDLNSCMSEEEIVPSVGTSRSLHMEIDLEALPLSETEEDIPPQAVEQKQAKIPLEPSSSNTDENPQDEADRNAAEAIVSISAVEHLDRVEETACDLAHPIEAPFADSLLWFAELVSSSADNLKKKHRSPSRGKEVYNAVSTSDEMDEFEAMALSLPELTEEEYMPKPLVEETQMEEETGLVSMPTRARKGPARRGRPRRDFQRDILPGLASLSRHEVTEDLQTFGGLMRATGHSWQSGPNRRNGGRNGGAARGRRRPVVEPVAAVCTPLVQQLNNIEVGLEDRCLTGWGKTPRRPRRQRCAPGNPTLIPLT